MTAAEKAHATLLELESLGFKLDDDTDSQFSESDTNYYSAVDCDSSDESESTEGSESEASEYEKSTGLFLSLDMVKMLRVSTSTGNLVANSVIDSMTNPNQQPRRHSGGESEVHSNMVYALQTKSALESPPQHAASTADIPKPSVTFRRILEGKGFECKYYNSKDVQNIFVEGSVSSHTLELMVRMRKISMWRDDMSILE